MRGFDEEERAEIWEELIETARKLLTVHGFQKTTVEDVTEPVGIAESTFYRFFDSKSELYTEVLIRENEALIEAIEAEQVDEEPPADRLERFLAVWAREFEQRPLLMQSHQSPRKVLRHVDEDALEAGMERFVSRMVPIIEALQADSDGLITEMEPIDVLLVLSVTELVVAQRELFNQFTEHSYEPILDSLHSVLVHGLLGAPAT